MNLTIHNAHNGLTVSLQKPIRYHSYQSFKDYIVDIFTCFILDNDSNVFLLTQFGMRVDFNIINELNDIYFFDKRLFVSDNPRALLKDYSFQTSRDIPPPKHPTLAPYSSALGIRQMSSTLRSNAGWSMSVKADAALADEQIRAYKRQISVMFRCLSIMFEFIASFTSDIESSFTKFYNHINQLSIKTLHEHWKSHYKTLASRSPFTFKNGTSVRLVDMLNYDALVEASQFVESNLSTVVDQFNQLSATINEVNKAKIDIDGEIQALRDESIAEFASLKASESLLEDIKSIGSAISTEIDSTASSESRALADIYTKHVESSKKLDEKYVQLYNDLTKLAQFKAKLAEKGTDLFQHCARLQMQMVNVKLALNEFDSRKQEGKQRSAMQKVQEIKKKEEYLSLTIDLPLLFGFAIIEMRRQYEWYDFFASGAVSNVTEQLQAIINQERAFRKIWAKKIGSFLSTLDSLPSDLPQTLPSLDVTVVKGRQDFFGEFWTHDIQREDINSYIKWVGSIDSGKHANFSTLLERNFEDLIKSTNAMKSVTKAIGTLSSYTSPENIDAGQSNDKKEDQDLIQGYKNRIRKLENLLHQHQFKDLSTWPVIKGSSQDQSIIFNPKRNASGSDNVLVRSQHDTKILLQNRRSSVDHSKLAKENEDLTKRLQQLEIGAEKKSETKVPFEASVTGTKVLAQQNTEILAQKKALDIKVDSQLQAIEKLKKESSEKDNEILALKKQIQQQTWEANDFHARNAELQRKAEQKYDQLVRELKEEKDKSARLTSELQAIKSGAKDRNDAEKAIAELTSVASDLFGKLVDHSHITFDYVLTLSYILEKMGLMLTNEEGKNDVFKIRRVKGLRARKQDGENPQNDVGSPVPGAIKSMMVWSHTDVNMNNFSDTVEAANQIISVCRDKIDETFDKYSQVVGFRSNVSIEQVSEHDIRTIEFFSNAVVKRFKDVEGLAKKLAKEKKTFETQLQKLTRKMSAKVTLSNFQTNDLVLFLPTRLETKEPQEVIQPWTAFNIGAPHYFLKNQPSDEREWIVARIVNIVEHTVTSANKNDASLNPYRLSEGITWFSVEAKEVGNSV
ncbi:Autophagy-related protein 11 [Meyerozyma sp. JA9]|nr:Autophagy-related protein 11 [Meyerozyma sp. JA9]